MVFLLLSQTTTIIPVLLEKGKGKPPALERKPRALLIAYHYYPAYRRKTENIVSFSLETTLIHPPCS